MGEAAARIRCCRDTGPPRSPGEEAEVRLTGEKTRARQAATYARTHGQCWGWSRHPGFQPLGALPQTGSQAGKSRVPDKVTGKGVGTMLAKQKAMAKTTDQTLGQAGR